MRRRNGLKHITNLATNRAKKYCLIIGWGLLLFNTSHAQQDTLLIKSFNPGDYKASALTYTGSMGADGFYYFANENGILKYDGSRWELITINNFSAVYSMSIDSTGRIYVGGFGEIGYVEKVKNRYKYTSLTNLIGEDRVNDEFWQTELFKGDVYFASYESIYRYDGTEIFKINHKNSHIFVVDNQLITSVFGGGTYQIKSDSVILINEQKNPSNDAAFAILPTNVPTQFWALTSVSELTKFNSNDYTMHKLEIPAADNLKRAAIYDGVLWNDSLYVLSSWNEGLLFLNKKGELVKTIKQENGLPTNSLRELFIDERMNIWVTSEYGIIYLIGEKKRASFLRKLLLLIHLLSIQPTPQSFL